MRNTAGVDKRLQEAVERISQGINIRESQIYASYFPAGKFRDEINLDISLKKGAQESHLIYVKVFFGRNPYYLPWVEFFGIDENVKIDEKVIRYFDSPFEDKLLGFFSEFIVSGGKIFIEYYNDRETADALIRDIPPQLTRLGYKLFNLGFTWFKDWYFPEGYFEGGQKLQGEKPINDDARIRHLKQIYDATGDFIKKAADYPQDKLYMPNALKRAKEILSKSHIPSKSL